MTENGDDAKVQQRVAAERDTYTAGRDIVVLPQAKTPAEDKIAELVLKQAQENRSRLFGTDIPGDAVANVEYARIPGRLKKPGGCERGDLRSVREYYQSLPTRRLVITGSPGAGKSVLLLELQIRLLEEPRTRPDTPVPVIVSAATYDTADNWEDWLTEQISLKFNLRKRKAAALVSGGRILPLIDGLDDMDPARDAGPERAQALIRSLNGSMRGRERASVVVTCRPGEYARIADGIDQATHVKLVGLTGGEASAYLRGKFRTAAERDRWKPVVETLERDQDGPVAAELATPSRLALALDAFRSEGDPAQMLPPPGITGSAYSKYVEDKLLGAYISAAVGLRGKNPSPYPEPDVRRWLASLANGLARQARQGRSATDITLHEWWHPRNKRAARPHAIIRTNGPAALAGGLAAGLASGLAGGPTAGLAGGLVTGLAIWLAISARIWGRYHLAVARNASQRTGPGRFRNFLDWAVDAGILRKSGISYQFRHRQFQDWLASAGDAPGPYAAAAHETRISRETADDQASVQAGRDAYTAARDMHVSLADGGESGTGTSGPEGGEGGPPEGRYLLARCQDIVPVGKPFSLLASIIQTGAGAAVPLLPFAVPSAGQDILLVLHAPGLRLLGDQRLTVHVPTAGDSDPVMFELRADEEGPRPVSITAWLGGSFLGELVVEVTADLGCAGGQHREFRAEIETEPSDGAVSLVVRYDPAQRAYRFEFRDEDNPGEVVSRLSFEPRRRIEGLLAGLDRLASGRSGYSPEQAREYLINAGAELWRELVPPGVREQFWDRQHRIRQLTILADRDTVPWELLYPKDPGRDEGFLVQQFPVTRGIFGRRPAPYLSLWPARFVLPRGSLAEAEAEIGAMRRLLDPSQRSDAVVSDLTQLLDLIRGGDFGLLHFACHNRFEPDDDASIMLGSTQFTPRFMTTAVIDKVLAGAAPTVFVNACRSAGLAPTYNRLDGWADKFLEAGAGAFIGSLWAVSDGAAREFAEELYGQLKTGAPLGIAMMDARAKAATHADDPTWLAYSAYGNPRARIKPAERS